MVKSQITAIWNKLVWTFSCLEMKQHWKNVWFYLTRHWLDLANQWLDSYSTPVAHLTWKKVVCGGRAAFDIIFQHETTFSLKTGNRPMNSAILPYFGNPSCYFVSDWLTQIFFTLPDGGCAAFPIASSSGQYSCHTTIVPINRSMT